MEIIFSLFLLELDRSLFFFINSDLACVLLDWILPALRNKYFWIPLYVFILSFLYFNFPFKTASIFIIFLFLSIIASDSSSSRFVKNYVKRERPCNHPYLQENVRLIVPCGSGYSFTSSHATNHFTMAMFLILTLGRIFKKTRWPLIIWASLISFAQVYVGVHYPLDVVFGSVLGILIGSFFAVVYNGWISPNIYAD